jgi:hypothetical protein
MDCRWFRNRLDIIEKQRVPRQVCSAELSECIFAREVRCSIRKRVPVRKREKLTTSEDKQSYAWIFDFRQGKGQHYLLQSPTSDGALLSRSIFNRILHTKDI